MLPPAVTTELRYQLDVSGARVGDDWLVISSERSCGVVTVTLSSVYTSICHCAWHWIWKYFCYVLYFIISLAKLHRKHWLGTYSMYTHIHKQQANATDSRKMSAFHWNTSWTHMTKLSWGPTAALSNYIDPIALFSFRIRWGLTAWGCRSIKTDLMFVPIKISFVGCLETLSWH